MKHHLLYSLIFLLPAIISTGYRPAGDKIKTTWGEAISPDNVWNVYPRPQMQRGEWQSLNGLWNLGEKRILVPFAVESSLSGIGQKVAEGDTLVYSREFTVPKQWKGSRILLHFDAVDWYCELYLNGKYVGSHTGG